MKEDSMEAEVLKDQNGSTPSVNKNDLILMPVSHDESGEGLPYAPENWPNPGDKWCWRTGKRVAITGHFLDRYLYPPRRLCGKENSSRRGYGFASKLSIEKFIQALFPDVDVDAFFASFSWRIPAKKSSIVNGIRGKNISPTFTSKQKKKRSATDSQIDTVACKAGNKNCNSSWVEERSASDSEIDTGGCKAGNKNCISLQVSENPSLLEVMSCDICCIEPRFCRDCCCILCSKTIDTTKCGYSYIKCEAMVGEGYICGHLAHIDCGLRSYLAGTVGGSIGLDAEYFCRRCDSRTDLVGHVQSLLQSCETTDSRDDIEKILGLGVSILRGSQKTRAKELLRRMEFIISKLKSGTSLENIWNMDENFSSICTDVPDHETTELQDLHETSSSIISSEWTMSTPFDHQTESIKLENEIDQVLRALKRSQEFEYNLAEERLQSHKSYLLNLFQQLDEEQTELSHQTSSTKQDAFLITVSHRSDQIKREVKKLKKMVKVADGFGRTPKVILKEEFGLEVEE